MEVQQLLNEVLKELNSINREIEEQTSNISRNLNTFIPIQLRSIEGRIDYLKSIIDVNTKWDRVEEVPKEVSNLRAILVSLLGVVYELNINIKDENDYLIKKYNSELKEILIRVGI